MADVDRQIREGMPPGMEDALLGAPCEFFAGKSRYLLRRPCLGVVILTRRILAAAGIDGAALIRSPFTEALKAAEEKRRAVLELLVHYTLTGKEAHYDSRHVGRRVRRLDKALSTEEVAKLLLVALTLDNYEEYIRTTGIETDLAARGKALRAKKDTSTIHFGGHTLFGTVVDAACAKYGWTADYCVWGVPYITLRLLFCDAFASVYMSEEEMKRYRRTGGITTAVTTGGGTQGRSGRMNFSQFLSSLKSIKNN